MWEGEDVSICGCMGIDILILVYQLYNLVLFVLITKGSYNEPKINDRLSEPV
jgi:hypothetical protein